MNGISAGVLEVLQLPFAPFVEFLKAFEDIRMADAMAVGTGDSMDRLMVRFGDQMEALYRQRERVFDGIRAGGNSPESVAQVKRLASQFGEFGSRFIEQEGLTGDLAMEVLKVTGNAADELRAFARDLEADLLGGRPSAAPSVPDAKLLTALDRLGFSLEDLPKLDAKLVHERFKERAIQFHPDTKPEQDKAFYEDQMKQLNEAKDLLTAHLGR